MQQSGKFNYERLLLIKDMRSRVGLTDNALLRQRNNRDVSFLSGPRLGEANNVSHIEQK